MCPWGKIILKSLFLHGHHKYRRSVISGSYFTAAVPEDPVPGWWSGMKGCERGIVYPDLVK